MGEKISRDFRTKHNDPREESFTLTYTVHNIQSEIVAARLHQAFDKIVLKESGQKTLDPEDEGE